MEMQHFRQRTTSRVLSCSDENGIKRNTRIQICIVTLVVILLMMLWPFHVFKYSAESVYPDNVYSHQTGAVTMDRIILQPFSPLRDHIADIEIQVSVSEVHEQDRVFVTIYNADYEIIWQDVVYFTDIEALGYLSVTPDLDVLAQQRYYMGLNVHYESEGVLTAAYSDIQGLRMQEMGSVIYAGEEYAGQAILMRFHYTKQFSFGLKVICTAAILAMGIFLYNAVVRLTHFYKNLPASTRKIIRKYMFYVLGAVYTILLMQIFYRTCISKMFGKMSADLAVYAITVILLAVAGAVFLYRQIKMSGRKHDTAQEKIANSRQKKAIMQRTWEKYTDISMWHDYLQTIFLVLLLYAGIMYVNSSVQWKQDLNANWVLLLFGLTIISFYHAKELFHIGNLLWGLVLIPVGMVYCHLHAGENHGERVGAVLMVAVFVWGMILIRTIRTWNRKKMSRLNLPMGIIWGLLCIGMIFAAHGKSWTAWMAVTFTLFYLQYDSDRVCRRVLHNFSNAVLANFGLILLLCLLYRPFEYYQFYRYPMWFHTVASTGMYLILVETVVLIRLYICMREKRRVFLGCEKEWLLYGVVTSYIIFSGTRTTLMGVGGILLILFIATAITERAAVKHYIQVLGMLSIIVVLCFPVCYTATRCIPAVVNRPRYIVEELEDFKEAVKRGDAPDSYKYMNIKALFKRMGERFGLTADTSTGSFGDTATQNVKMGIYAVGLSASADESVLCTDSQVLAEQAQTSKINELSNGRIEIFRMYLKNLNWTGHDSMVMVNEEGDTIAHAHNSFIQTAYDFGIPTGILSLALCLTVILRSVWLIWKNGDRSEASYLSMLIPAAYLITSISEYTANPNMPLGFAYLFVLITMRMNKNMIK